MPQTIVGETLQHIPWQDRPAGSSAVVWRYSANPIIARNAVPFSNSIFNSAVVPFEDGFAGVFRVDDKTRLQTLHVGFSDDGIAWRIAEEPLTLTGAEGGLGPFEYGYDPRVCRIEDRYYVTWCNGYRGMPTIGVAVTQDFRTFAQMENAFLPFNRNGVLFPRKIGGKYHLLSRPSDSGHTPFGEIFVSSSPDMVHWGCHRHVFGPQQNWERTKVGAGPTPIETRDGWLMIYHGVLTSCNGFTYAMGAALLDLERPWQVIARCREYLLAPETPYEQVGDVPNVVFPCAALTDAATGRMAIYYGAADTSTALCFAQVDELLAHIKAKSLEPVS